MIRCLVCLPVLLFEVASESLVVAEELRKILGATVCLGPLEFSGIPFGFLVFSSFFLSRLLFFLFFTFTLLLFLLGRFLSLGLLDHVWGDIEHGRFLLALESNDANNFTDVALDGEEFIHKSKLEALLVLLKLIRVAEALEKDEALACAVLSNLLLDKLNN